MVFIIKVLNSQGHRGKNVIDPTYARGRSGEGSKVIEYLGFTYRG